MSYSFLIFDFGGKEDAAQQARHRIDGWKQGFRLDKKLQVKFDRKDPEATADAGPAAPPTAAKPAAKNTAKPGRKAKSAAADSEPAPAPSEPPQIHLIVRLDFSDHEKLSHQRWLDRIPMEEPFKAANPKIVRAGDADFRMTAELFDSLD